MKFLDIGVSLLFSAIILFIGIIVGLFYVLFNLFFFFSLILIVAIIEKKETILK